jgi:hypothetical protein
MRADKFIITCLSFIVLLPVAVCSLASNPNQHFNKSEYYKVLAENSQKKIDAYLQIINTQVFTGKEAFEGALLMKKAGLIKVPARKLNLFKEGRKKLENAIKADADNTEFRFLRLVIQEQAPDIVNYRGHLQEDGELVKKNFNILPVVVKEAIINYSKKSKLLREADFK